MKTIGILGAGQLARMLSLAAYTLGWRTICLDPAAESCASEVTKVIRADYSDTRQLQLFAEKVDVITVENENIPIECLEQLRHIKPIWPSAIAIAYAQDRLHEKQLFQQLNIPTTAFAAIHDKRTLKTACELFAFPLVLKTRRMGYDGKGQFILRSSDDIEPALDALGRVPLILENWVEFEREVSIIAARDTQGQVAFYPLVENQHKNGMLHVSKAPYLNKALNAQAQAYATELLNFLQYVGILTIEFFVKEGTLIANEMAPRVHNSGHWTIEGAVTSQFLQHIRAISGLPLGDTGTRGFSGLVNCIGTEPALATVLSHPHVYYHSYQKTPKPNRKLGHITVNCSSEEERNNTVAILQQCNPFSLDL